MKKKIIKLTYFHKNANLDKYFSDEFFNDFEFHVNDPSCVVCDYWIVYGGLLCKNEVAFVDPKNIFLFVGEHDGQYSYKFLEQFSKVFTIDPHYTNDNLVYHHTSVPWFIDEKFDELYHQQKVHKDRVISIVASDKAYTTYTRNYRHRYEFVKTIMKYFGNNIDVFGRGFKEIENKSEALLRYKYSIAIENVPLPFNITEKIADCFLMHTFPFYYACPNIDRFYPRDAYENIDIMDIDFSIKVIESILKTAEHYEKHVAAIIEAKKIYLMNYSFQSAIVNGIKRYGTPAGKKQIVKINDNNRIRSNLKIKIIDLTFNLLK